MLAAVFEDVEAHDDGTLHHDDLPQSGARDADGDGNATEEDDNDEDALLPLRLVGAASGPLPGFWRRLGPRGMGAGWHTLRP